MKTLAYFVGAVVGDGDQLTLFIENRKKNDTTMKRNLYFLSNNSEPMGGIYCTIFELLGQMAYISMFLQSPIFNDTAKESSKKKQQQQP